MTPARPVIPGRTVFITSRCTNRQFRAVPTKKNVEALWYCLTAAATAYPGIALHGFLWMSNHLHLVATPADDSLPRFMQYLNSLSSRTLNAIRGTSGPNFEPHYNVVTVTDPEQILEYCAYTLANPCAADLVTRAANWKGVSSWGMAFGEVKVVKRPKKGLWKRRRGGGEESKDRSRERSRGRARFRDRWVTPDEAKLVLTRPPGFDGMTDEELDARLRERVHAREEKAEAKRAASGRRVLGMRRVRAQKWNALPAKPEDMFGPVPKASGKNQWKRLEAEQRDREFEAAHRVSVEAFGGGDREVMFPFGTWLMRHRFNVCCAQGPP